MADLTTAQRDLARHALGLPNSARRSNRNHFITGPYSPDHAQWEAMVAAGFANVRRSEKLFSGDDVFWLTQAGADAALMLREALDPENFPPEGING